MISLRRKAGEIGHQRSKGRLLPLQCSCQASHSPGLCPTLPVLPRRLRQPSPLLRPAWVFERAHVPSLRGNPYPLPSYILFILLGVVKFPFVSSNRNEQVLILKFLELFSGLHTKDHSSPRRTRTGHWGAWGTQTLSSPRASESHFAVPNAECGPIRPPACTAPFLMCENRLRPPRSLSIPFPASP